MLPPDIKGIVYDTYAEHFFHFNLTTIHRKYNAF